MSANLLTTMNSLFGDGVIHEASAALGESESGLGKALRAGIPALLAGTMKQAASPAGASELFRTITGSGVDEGIAEHIGDMSASPNKLGQALTTGKSLLSNLFGSRTKDVTGAISQTTGVKSNLAMQALAMAAPVVFGLLKKQVSRGHLDAQGLASFLGDQREAVLDTGMDDRITSAMGVGNLREALDALPGGTAHAERPATHTRARDFSTSAPRVEDRPTRKSSWWPWAAAIGAAALALWFIGSMDRERGTDEARVAAADATGGSRTEPAAGTTALPVDVYFDTNQVAMDGTARESISAVADSALASGQSLAVTAFAGSTDDQQQVAQRAELVREALVQEGMDYEKVVVMAPEIDRQARGAEAGRVQISPLD